MPCNYGSPHPEYVDHVPFQALDSPFSAPIGIIEGSGERLSWCKSGTLAYTSSSKIRCAYRIRVIKSGFLMLLCRSSDRSNPADSLGLGLGR